MKIKSIIIIVLIVIVALVVINTTANCFSDLSNSVLL